MWQPRLAVPHAVHTLLAFHGYPAYRALQQSESGVGIRHNFGATLEPLVRRDFKRLQNDPPQGVSGAPMDNNIMQWNAVIFGCAGPRSDFVRKSLVCSRTRTRTCTRSRTHAYTRTRAHAHTRTCTNSLTHARMHARTRTRTHNTGTLTQAGRDSVGRRHIQADADIH
jgi:hypothetical protein